MLVKFIKIPVSFLIGACDKMVNTHSVYTIFSLLALLAGGLTISVKDVFENMAYLGFSSTAMEIQRGNSLLRLEIL